MMILLRLTINVGALLLLPYLLTTIQVESVYTAIITAVILGLINVSIKPIVKILTLPISILTLGLFALIINGFFFWFVASFVEGFSVDGFWAAILGAIYMSIVSWLTSTFIVRK